MKTTKAKPTVFVHAAMVLVRKKDGTIDVCDPGTGVWSSFTSERHAKWSATVYTNLSGRFGHSLPGADEAYVRHLELKHKGVTQ